MMNCVLRWGRIVMGKIVMKSKERSYGIDILKIMATFMVVILHVNGFILDSKTIDDFTRTTKLVWHFSEAFAYPAIHLFVMITAWFAIDRTFNYKSIINVWLQTIQVCILGIVIAFFANLSINVNDLFVSSLPFIGRAYWYVTDYILLMLMSPILNIVVNRLSNKQLIKFVILLLGMLSIGPLFFATYNWNQDYSNIGLFILLYFITAVIKRNEEIYTKMMGGIIWLISLFVLVSSWVGIHLLGKYGIVSCLEKEMFFYQYCSPFVISQAVGLVMLFSKINIVTINEFAKK